MALLLIKHHSQLVSHRSHFLVMDMKVDEVALVLAVGVMFNVNQSVIGFGA